MMTTSSKFNLSTGSTDRPLYTSGQRGSYTSASMERSASFRESTQNAVLASLPNMSRSGSVMSQEDVMSFFQCLRSVPKMLASELKSNRYGDFKRHLSVALGVSPESSPSGSSKAKVQPSPSPEEFKRVKAALREGSVKPARERIKIFNEALSVLNKFLPTKKRSRLDAYSNERSTSFLSGDRPVHVSSLSKMGTQNQGVSSCTELDQHKSEERAKNTVPNKRTRTSMADLRMDARSNSLVRTPGVVDRLANISAVQGEDQTLPAGIDGWDRSKLKKKRSVIKPDNSSGTVSTKSTDGYREPKPGVQQKLNNDARSRLNGDSRGFRPGIANGAGVGKADGLSPQNGSGMHPPVLRTELDNNSLVCDGQDRPIGSDKGRMNMKALNKTNSSDGFNSASPTLNPKSNTSVRAPRSASAVAPKFSAIHRAAVPNDWEPSYCTTKNVTSGGANNRKRTVSTRSPSPPVANWAGQRPQKISRSARRANFGPIISSNDDTPISDTASEVTENEVGLGFARRLSGNSPQQVKLKGDPLSSMAHSESEESGAADIKSREKVKKSADELDEKPAQNVHKVSSLVLPSRKNKLVSGEELGDGIRRQGRTVRTFTSTRSLLPVSSEKLGNIGTAKQLRSAKLGFDKMESKGGRPPTRKLSDRKAYSRQKHANISAATDFLDDAQGELFAAANAVISRTCTSSSPFWKQMEPFFGFISDVDIAYLRQQVHLQSAAPLPSSDPLNSNCCVPTLYEPGALDNEREMWLSTGTRSSGVPPEELAMQRATGQNEISLCQRLLAALISEDENDNFCSSEREDGIFDACGSPNDNGINGNLEANGFNHHFAVNSQFHRTTDLNNYMICGEPEHSKPGSDGMEIERTGYNSNLRHASNGFLSDEASLPSMACSELQYANMNINDKLLLEIQSIGSFPDIRPTIQQTEDDEVSEEICKLEKLLERQATDKKVMLDRLQQSGMETKEFQEREFEQDALDKLVEMAYQKYMSCRRVGTSGGKSSSNKLAKQAALAFIKRTLDQCHKYENTGKSCFSEPIFRELFLSGLSHFSGGIQMVDTAADGQSVKQSANTPKASVSLQGRTSTLLTQNVDGHDANTADVKEDTWSNRVKKREVLLDDVGGMVGAHPGDGSLAASTKGKRSDRDREGKGHGRDTMPRHGSNKIGRLTQSSVKGERKSKSKPKQKMTQLSVSVNGLRNVSDQAASALPSASDSGRITNKNNAKEKDDVGLDELEDPIDLSHLQLPGMDDLGGPDEQGQDLGSWLNIDDDSLQDHDIMGLEIPMDDLSELKMLY